MVTKIIVFLLITKISDTSTGCSRPAQQKISNTYALIEGAPDLSNFCNKTTVNDIILA